MAFKKASKQPEPRDESLAWEDNGPGLHGDEIAVKLDTGELIAVSVEPHWAENNAGLGLHGWARLINPDGSSKEVNDKVIETSVTVNITPLDRERFGEDALAKELFRVVLGEPPSMVPIEPNPDAPPLPEGRTYWIDAEGHQHWSDPGATERAMIPMAEDARLNGNIRNAIAATETMKQGINPALALDL